MLAPRTVGRPTSSVKISSRAGGSSETSLTGPPDMAPAMLAATSASRCSRTTALRPSNSSSVPSTGRHSTIGSSQRTRSQRVGDAERRSLMQARRHETAIGDDHDLFAQVFDDVELVGREQDAGPRGGSFGDDRSHRLGGHGIEAGERFVEHEEIWLVHQRHGELRSLLIASRQLLDQGVRTVGQTQALEPVVGPVLRLGAAQSRQPSEVDDLLADLHSGVEAPFLGHVADPAPRPVVDRSTLPRDGSPIGPDHPEDRPHRGGLPRPIGSEETDQRSGRNREVQAVDGDHRSVALGEVGNLEPGTLLVGFGHERSVAVRRRLVRR